MAAPLFVPIGIIQQFAVLGNSGVTGSTGTGTAIAGDVGSSPTPTITNFPPSTVTPPFVLHTTNDATVIQARADGQSTYAYLASLAVDATLADDLTGQVITSGVYDFTTGAPNLPSGATLTLNGSGIFVFKVGSSLTAVTTSIVAGTASPSQIFWQIGTSATINGVNFRGSIFADASITIGDDTSLEGRAIAGLGATGAVTMAGDGGSTIGGVSIPSGTYQIQVNYTPQTTGCNTICYKQTSPNLDPTFCCITDNTTSTPGVPKSFIFEIAVTPCETGGPISPVGIANGTYTYEGTVTPCCGDFPVAWGPVDIVVAPV